MSDKGIKRQHNPISLSEHFDEYEIFCSCVDDAAGAIVAPENFTDSGCCVVFHRQEFRGMKEDDERQKNFYNNIINSDELSSAFRCRSRFFFLFVWEKGSSLK